jgi:hypothetical protein
MYLEALEKTVKAIKQKKILFSSLILLQIIFVSIFLFVSIDYQVRIFENLETVNMALDQANFDSTSIEEGKPFLEDGLKVISAANTMKSDIFELIGVFIGLFLIFNGLIWSLTQRIFIKKKKTPIKVKVRFILSAWLKYLTSSIIIMGPVIVASYFILKFLLFSDSAVNTFTNLFRVFIYIIIIFYYFALSAYAFLATKSWKNFIKKFYYVSIKNIHWSLIALLINMTLILGALFLVYIVMNLEILTLMLITALLLIIIMLITKLYWIACLHLIIKEKK